MLWPTTLLGAGAGFAIASIPGALLGALLGQALDRRLALQSWAHLRERMGGPVALREDELLFVLLGRLAKKDGRVVEQHIQQARAEMQRMGMGDSAQRRAIAAFNRGKDGGDNLRGYLRRLAPQPHTAEGLLRACWRMAWANGSPSRGERELIVWWGKWLGWSATRVASLAAEHEVPRKPLANNSSDYQAALKLLGVQTDTEPAHVKRAYRRLLSRHHPDKVAGSGASQLQVRDATDRTQDLHNAYKVIKARRGF
ncbi:molecular chaperone DjlA [Pseudomonas sp. S25]|uniref:Molecular chaperone DjlA n=1 Tax=Pseudomonas maioricensis TaxID=1766623 RepID=A0ABS9ZF29_9PSED|nr:DnaJ domain-containing protein [Pseudomonas sp. S25]MCI8208443.1 molecular chaperone DjlA [Pseudomonas sp. S25]